MSREHHIEVLRSHIEQFGEKHPFMNREKREYLEAVTAAYNALIEKEDMNRCHEPMTNADRIRAMSDEELAKFIFHCMHTNSKALCKEQVEDWLKQPVEEDA